MEDVPLPDPIRMGLPKFANAPLKKRHSWRPRSPQEEDNREVLYLMGRIKMLAKSGLTIIEVMSICIMRGCSHFSIGGNPYGTSMEKTMPPTTVVKVRTPPPLWRKYCPICTKERKRSSSALSHGMDFPCTTPKLGALLSFTQLHSFPHSSSQIFILLIHSRNCEKLRGRRLMPSTREKRTSRLLEVGLLEPQTSI